MEMCQAKMRLSQFFSSFQNSFHSFQKQRKQVYGFCCWFYPKPKRLTSSFMMLYLPLHVALCPASIIFSIGSHVHCRPPTSVVHLPPATFSPQDRSPSPHLHFPQLTITLRSHNPNTFTALCHLLVFPTPVSHQRRWHRTLQLRHLLLQNDIIALLQHPLRTIACSCITDDAKSDSACV